MRKKIKNVARVILAFSIAMMLTNCEKENIDVNNQDTSVINVKNWFEKSNPELTILKYTKQIDWDHAIVTDGTKGKVVEVPIILNENNAVKSIDKSFAISNRLMFIVDEKEAYKLSHVLITTKEHTFATSDKTINYYKINDGFEGYITVLNAKNKVSSFNTINAKVKTPTSSITKKMKSEDQVCLAMCKMYDDGSYDVLYIISCGGGASSGGAGGGGYGGEAPAEDNLCKAGLNDLISSSAPTSEFISSTIVSESNTTRTKNYAWTIFSGPGYRLCSSETGVQKKVIDSNPSLQWEWISLTHNSIYKEGIVAGGDISYSTIYAQPTIGAYNSVMDLNYNVKFAFPCNYSPITLEQNYNSHKVINVNE